LRRRLAYVDGDGADAPTNTSCANGRHVLYSGKKGKRKKRKEKERQGKKSTDKKATERGEDWRMETKIKE